MAITMTDVFNIRFTEAGINKVLEVFGELPNKSGTHPLLMDMYNQAKAEAERIAKAAAAPTGIGPDPSSASGPSEASQSS